MGYFKKSDFDTCITSFKDTISLTQRSLFDDELHRELASLFQKISSVHFHAGNYDEALESYELCLMNRKSYLPQENVDISLTLQYMAAVYAIKGMHEQALQYYKESLNGCTVEDKVKILNEMGILCSKINWKDEALVCYQKALAMVNSKLFPELLVLLLNNIGNIYRQIGDLDKAMTCYMDALSLCPETKGAVLQNQVSNIMYNVGLIYFMRHSFSMAHGKFQQFLQTQVTDILTYDVESNLNLSSALNSVGNCKYMEGDYDEALEWYQESLELKESHLKKPNQRISGTLSNMSTAKFFLGDYDKALHYLEKSLEHINITNKNDEKRVAMIMDKMGSIYLKKKDYHNAMSYYERALQQKLSASSNMLCSEVLVTKHNIALVSCHEGDYKKARKLLCEVYKLKSQLFGKKHVEVAKVILDIGCVSFAMNDYSSAKNLCSQAYEILNEFKLPLYHPYMCQGRGTW